MTERLIVVGGDAAGMSAAAQARRRAAREDLEIVVFERGEYASFSACGLPYLVGGHVNHVDELIARSPAQHRAHGIDLRTGHEVVAVDADGHTVTVRELASGVERTQPFGQLVIAAGASPRRPPVPGADAKGVHGIHTVSDGIALRDHVEAHRHANQRAVVVGGGYIGLELAEAMHEIGLPVTVVDSGEQPMPALDPDMGAIVAKAMRSLGIELHTRTRVVGFETVAHGHVRAVLAADDTSPRTSSCSVPACDRTSSSRATPVSRSARRARSKSMRTWRRAHAACGPQATASSRSTASAGGRCTFRSARTRTSRVASRGRT